jgi:hypothetical protein
MSSSDPHLPALGRWHGAQLARECRAGAARTGRAASALSPAPPRPATLTVEVPTPESATPWRGRYHLVVIDGEVLLIPRRVDDPDLRFRAYAGREEPECAPLSPGARPIDARLRGLAAALQAHLDATGAEGNA